VTDGLKGIPEALGKEFPAMTLQTCIMNLIRNSLSYASWKERKPIYAALNADAATAAIDEFKQGSWGKKSLTVVASGLGPSDTVLCDPSGGRRVIYMNDATESLESQLRKIIKNCGHFLSDDTANKLMWLRLRNNIANWGRTARK
jgi:transposase-like protein